jgi:hypothetical protein
VKVIKSRLGVAASGVALLLAAGPATADVINLPDADDDAFAITASNVTVGDYDIDLRSVLIDHGTSSVLVASTFTYTNADSWTDLTVQFDVNGDRVSDYTALWSKDSGAHGVLRNNPDGTDTVTCTSAGPAEAPGVNGTVSLNIPRNCLGNPASVAVHVDVLWAGYNVYGYELYFVDSAPGLLTDEPVSYSAPVATSNTGTVTSPAPPAPVAAPPVAKSGTKVSASLSSKTQVAGSPVKMKVRITGEGNPSGIVKVTSGATKIRTMRVTARKVYTVRMPADLRPGINKIKARFIPTDQGRFLQSTKIIRLVVRRR